MLANGARKGIIALKGVHQQQVEHGVFLQDREDIELFLLMIFIRPVMSMSWYKPGKDYTRGRAAFGWAVVNKCRNPVHVAWALTRHTGDGAVTVTGWVENPFTVSSLIGTPFHGLWSWLAPGQRFCCAGRGSDDGCSSGRSRQTCDEDHRRPHCLPSSHQLERARVSYKLEKAQAACCNCTACTEICPGI